MAISKGNASTWENGGNPTTQAFNSNAGLMIGLLAGRNAAGGTPGLTEGTYDGDALTSRQSEAVGWVAAEIADVHNASQGANNWVASGGNCTYSAWGALSAIGARTIGAYKAGGKKSGAGAGPATLDAAIATYKGGIAVAIAIISHHQTLPYPAGWGGIFTQDEAGGARVTAAYKFTTGASLNPVFIIGASVTKWAVVVASYYPMLVGTQAMLIA